MSFVLFILSNVFRQKIRTGLTVVGISIGITAVVALGIITESARAAVGGLLTGGGADMTVWRAGSSDLTFSILTEDDVAKVSSYPEVSHITPVLLAVSKVGSNPFFTQFGLRAEDLDVFEVPLAEGRRLAPGASNEIMLGKDAADQLGKSVGDTVEIRDVPFTVVGIYDMGAVYFDGGAILPLAAIQSYERKEGLYSALFVHLRSGADVDALKAQIDEEHPDLAVVVTADDLGQVDQGLEILDAVTLGITILAIFIGGIAVMNTMVMAVFERTREFGILRALGWRTRRILQMVLAESLVLCLIGAAVGSLVAVLLTQLLVLVPTIQAFISPVYTPMVFLRGLAVGLAVALLGALYPAFRAANFSPAQAIRYE